MYFNKLNGDLQFFLKNEDEMILNDIDGNNYMKVSVTSDIIAIYFSKKENIEDLKLLFFYSKSKKDIVMVFEMDKKIKEKVFKNLNNNNTESNSSVVDKNVLIKIFNDLVNKEFQSLIETMEIDDTDMKYYQENKEFIEKVKLNYFLDSKQQSIEEFYCRNNFTLKELANIGTNIYDFAYEEMEKHLTKEILSKIKEYVIIQRMINFPEIYFGKEYQIEKEFIYIGNRTFIKNLKLTIETNSGVCIETLVENSPKFYKKYPLYAIREIESVGNIIYRRDESLAEIYKNDLEYNESLTGEQLIYIPMEWFDNEKFIEIMALKTERIYPYISSRLKNDKNFVLKLMKNISLFQKKELYNNLSMNLRLDKGFLMFLMKEVSVSFFEEAEFSLQIYDDVLEYYFSNTTCLKWTDKLINQLFKQMNVQESFSKFYCNRNVIIPFRLLKYITDIEIAKSYSEVVSSGELIPECNFKYFSEELRFENLFVYAYIAELSKKEMLRKISFMSVYNFLSKKQKEDEDLCCELISNLYIGQKCDYEYNLSDLVKTKKFKIAMLNNNLNMLKNLSKEEQDEVLKKKPLWIKHSYLEKQINFCEDHMNLLREIVITEPCVLRYFTILEDKTLEELSTLNPLCFRYISCNLRQVPISCLKGIQDKVYILNEIIYCSRSNGLRLFSITSTDLINFLLKQLKVKDKFSSPYIKMKDLIEFDKIYKTEFRKDKDLIYVLAKQNPNVVLNLPKKSEFRKDKEFAKFILEKDIYLIKWFHPSIWEDKYFVKEIYENLQELERENLSSFFEKFL